MTIKDFSLGLFDCFRPLWFLAPIAIVGLFLTIRDGLNKLRGLR